MQAEGLYRGKVKDWGITKAQTGKFQHFLLFEIDEQAVSDDNVDEGFEKVEKPFLRKVFKAMTPKTRDWLLSDLRSLGYDRKGLTATAIGKGNDDSFDFKDRLGVVECSHEVYKGVNKERWQVCTRKSSLKLTGEDISQLDQIFAAAEEAENFDPFAEAAEEPVTAAEPTKPKGRGKKKAKDEIPF